MRCRRAVSFTYQYPGTPSTAAQDDVVRTDELPLPEIQTVGPPYTELQRLHCAPLFLL